MNLIQQRLEDEFRSAMSLREQRLVDDLQTEGVGFSEPCAHCHSKKRTLSPHSQCGKRKKVLVICQHQQEEGLARANSALLRTPNPIASPHLPRYDRSYSAPIISSRVTTKTTTSRAALFRSNSVVPLMPWPSETWSPRSAITLYQNHSDDIHSTSWTVALGKISAATQMATASARKLRIGDDSEPAANAQPTRDAAYVENEAGGNDTTKAAEEKSKSHMGQPRAAGMDLSESHVHAAGCILAPPFKERESDFTN